MKGKSCRLHGPTRTRRLPNGDKEASKNGLESVPAARCPRAHGCPSLRGSVHNTIDDHRMLSYSGSYSDASSIFLIVLVRRDDFPHRPNGLRLLDGFGFFLNFCPLKHFRPTLRGLTLRMLDIQDVSNIAAPSLCQRMDGGFFGDVQGQFAAPGAEDVLAKLDFVGGEYLDALTTARNGHIPLLLARRRLHR